MNPRRREDFNVEIPEDELAEAELAEADAEELGGEVETDPEAYRRLVMASPARNVELPNKSSTSSDEEVATGGQGITDASENASDVTDTQWIHSHMFPKRLGTRVTNNLMQARITPESYLPLIRINTTDDIMKADPAKDVHFKEMLNENTILVSIGLDGRGRIDEAELAGAARELERAKRRLGLPE